MSVCRFSVRRFSSPSGKRSGKAGTGVASRRLSGQRFKAWTHGIHACKQTWCLTSTETTRLIRDGEKGEGCMEVGAEGDYNYTYR